MSKLSPTERKRKATAKSRAFARAQNAKGLCAWCRYTLDPASKMLCSFHLKLRRENKRQWQRAKAMTRKEWLERYRQLAKTVWANYGIVFEPDAKVNLTASGAYVQAWVWVDNPEGKETK